MKTIYPKVAGFVFAALISARSMAQTAPVPDHPRENEVNQRLDNHQARINQGLANGMMTGNKAAVDEKHDANIAQREAVNESKHNGHITKAEQNRLNQSENKNSKRIYRQKHQAVKHAAAPRALVSCCYRFG